ncbi:hypothetical protein PspLS_09331 [Pyricularia sp. CBS 133598]|nr:hypothetical protein PspLS_09331 [Pyricularia sp. CBS 133598]
MQFSTVTLLAISAIFPTVSAQVLVKNGCKCTGSSAPPDLVAAITNSCCGSATFGNAGVLLGTVVNKDNCDYSQSDAFKKLSASDSVLGFQACCQATGNAEGTRPATGASCVKS